MYFVGIDISKFKHDCAVIDNIGDVVTPSWSFNNDSEGFSLLAELLASLGKDVKIGFESTGHYGQNLKLFLESNSFTFMEFNPLLISRFVRSKSLRKTKTDSIDALLIAQYLMTVEYKPYPASFYHLDKLKSLTRFRDSLVRQRSRQLVELTNVLDKIFPEFKPFFKHRFSVTALFILSNYTTPEKIANMNSRSYETIRKLSRGKFTLSAFVQLKTLAKNTVGRSDDYLLHEMDMLLELYSQLDAKIQEIEEQVVVCIRGINPPMCYGGADGNLDQKVRRSSMYSLEDRIKAVQLYIDSGGDVLQVIRTLGYPSPNALRQWFTEYMQTGKLHQKLSRTPRYTSDQIEAAVAYYAEHRGGLIATVRALGYPDRNTLSQWVRSAHPEETEKPGQYCKSGRKLVRCTQEQKQAAVEAWIRGTPDYKVAAQYGVCKAAVYVWKKKLLGGESAGMKKRSKRSASRALPDDKAELEAEIQTLKEQILDLQMERDALEKAAEIIKKGKGIGLESLTNREKAEVIDALRTKYRLGRLLKLFRISKNSYFYSHSVSLRPHKYSGLRADVRRIFLENAQCYGYRRVSAVLRRDGIIASEKVVRRIMHEEQLTVHRTNRKRYSSYMGEISPAVRNIINRDFYADAPNEKWLTDLTEFALPAGKVYLSPVIDCFDGIVVNWTMGTSPNADLANTMIDGAIARLSDGEHPVIHSDRGGHYRWPAWIQKVQNAGLIRSMSKKGCSPDNAACEGFFGRLKNEMFYGRSWMGVSLQQFMVILDQYIHWYNEKRIKISLGAMSPVEYRRSLGLNI